MFRLAIRFSALVYIGAFGFSCQTRPGALTLNTNTGPSVHESIPNDLQRIYPEFFSTDSTYSMDRAHIIRAPGGAAILRARTCDAVEAEIKSLAEFRARQEPGFQLDPATLSSVSALSSGCAAKVDTLLTPYLAQSLLKNIDDNAVQTNCWNHALIASGIIPFLQETDDATFTFITRGPYCKAITDSNDLKAGDVIALQSVAKSGDKWEYAEVHAAASISETLWASKFGSGVFEIRDSNSVFGQYFSADTDQACLRLSPDQVDEAYLEKCGALVSAFRCEGMADIKARFPDSSGFHEFYDQAKVALSDLVYEQKDLETEGEIAIPGDAYISDSYHLIVDSRLATRNGGLSQASTAFLNGLKADPKWMGAYDLSMPAVPELAPALQARADEVGLYEMLTEEIRRLETLAISELKSGRLSEDEYYLFTLMALILNSSQKSGSELFSHFPDLERPDRTVRLR